MFGFDRSMRHPTTLEQRIESLAQIGIFLNPNATIEDLLESFDRSEYESESFDILMMLLGSQVENGINAGAYFTNQLWTHDTECIEGDGDYASIARRFDEMFGEELKITSPSDRVDHENEAAQLQFECNGKHYQAELQLDDDWMDADVLKLFLGASGDCRTNRIIGFGEPDGQSMSLCVLTPRQMKHLNKLAGTSYRPLTNSDF